MKFKSLILVCICLIAGCTDTQFIGPVPNPWFDGKADMARISRALDAKRIDEENMALILRRIEEFEVKSGNSHCSGVNFTGFDGYGDKIAAFTTRVKASAVSDCGASYYWLTLTEQDEHRVTSVEVERRSLQPGDKTLSRRSDGTWQLSVSKQ